MKTKAGGVQCRGYYVYISRELNLVTKYLSLKVVFQLLLEEMGFATISDSKYHK